MIALPDWIDRDMWNEYVSQRKKDKKEMGPTAIKGRLKRLYELHAAGHDVSVCMEEAINGHWLDFYEPQDKSIKTCAKAEADKTAEMLKEREARGYTAPPAGLKLVADRIRRAS